MIRKRSLKREEIWENIPSWPYQVSTEGRVRSLDRTEYSSTRGSYSVSGRVLSGLADNGKYRYVTLSVKGKRQNFYLHRLVAQAFCRRHSEESIEVNHKDGDKFNNFYKNLEWVTMLENREHAVDNDLIRFGEESHQSKLTEKQVIEILRAHKENPSVNRTHLAKKYGIWDPQICRIIKGKRWRRTYDKFHAETR